MIDTGSTVSTVSEKFFREQLSSGASLNDPPQFLKIRAANGLEIPYVGYFITNFVIGTDKLEEVGFLVTKDTQVPRRAPVLLGTNVLSRVETYLMVLIFRTMGGV